MRLLIIGSLESQITEAGKIAMAKGAKVTHADSTDKGLMALRNGKGADLVMIDVRQNVHDFILALKNERIVVPVVAFGIGADTSSAVAAIKSGAREYIPLPPNAELIAAVLSAVAEESNTFIASDPVMMEVLRMADQVAGSDATILITGESGTGKEVMASYIHAKSRRNTGPFIALNCAAIPESLLESELFGHEKGAFTGAVARRIGKFEEATNGTLFLDEVSEMPLAPQSKLLRAIQEKEITRVGSNTGVKVNIRLVATSNRNLEDYIKAGQFREDLYFRLNVINLVLPPLRDRAGDIMPLANFFAKKYCAANGVDEKAITQAAQTKLIAYHWPGNVRELENTIHRAVLLSGDGPIDEFAVKLSTSSAAPAAASAAVAAPAPQVGRTMADVERELIIDTLSHTLGNRTHAATILGISIRTLRNKLRQYSDEGVAVPPPQAGDE